MNLHVSATSNRREVRDALVALAYDRDELYNAVPTTHRDPCIALIEGVAHELAHTLEAGRNFEWRLEERNMEGYEANEHEAATLRIEVAALAELGVRVSLRNLWRDAGWRGEKPRFTRAARALTPRERKCVRAFVQLVRNTVAREGPNQ